VAVTGSCREKRKRETADESRLEFEEAEMRRKRRGKKKGRRAAEV
jgi:ribosome assembly protein YihI (activator of Der GTPase)